LCFIFNSSSDLYWILFTYFSLWCDQIHLLLFYLPCTFSLLSSFYFLWFKLASSFSFSLPLNYFILLLLLLLFLHLLIFSYIVYSTLYLPLSFSMIVGGFTAVFSFSCISISGFLWWWWWWWTCYGDLSSLCEWYWGLIKKESPHIKLKEISILNNTKITT
jgi:hypothetical protein